MKEHVVGDGDITCSSYIGLRSSSLARRMRVQGVEFASKNIGLSQPVPLSQLRMSADQRQVVLSSPRL